MIDGTAAPAVTGSEGQVEGSQTQATGDARPGYMAHFKDAGLKEHADLGKLAPTLDDLAKGYLDLHTRSANMVEIPGQDAAPEAVKAFRERMGVPETPDKYELPRLDGDYAELHSDERDSWFRNLAHNLNLPAEAAKRIVQEHNEMVVKEHEALRTQEAEAIKESESRLKTDWGKEYDGNLNMAQSAMKVLSEGNEEIEAALNAKTPSGARLGDHPALVKLFYNVAMSLTEASVDPGGLGSKEVGKKDAMGHHMPDYPSMKEDMGQ